ncbi:MAG: hypothetical protein WB869_18795 [Candidatus Acidiferrales bacterium]
MSQSTNGEIRAISVRSQVCSFSGAPVKRGLHSAACRDLKLPTQITITTSFQDLLTFLPAARDEHFGTPLTKGFAVANSMPSAPPVMTAIVPSSF